VLISCPFVEDRFPTKGNGGGGPPPPHLLPRVLIPRMIFGANPALPLGRRLFYHMPLSPLWEVCSGRQLSTPPPACSFGLGTHSPGTVFRGLFLSIPLVIVVLFSVVGPGEFMTVFSPPFRNNFFFLLPPLGELQTAGFLLLAGPVSAKGGVDGTSLDSFPRYKFETHPFSLPTRLFFLILLVCVFRVSFPRFPLSFFFQGSAFGSYLFFVNLSSSDRFLDECYDGLTVITACAAITGNDHAQRKLISLPFNFILHPLYFSCNITASNIIRGERSVYGTLAMTYSGFQWLFCPDCPTAFFPLFYELPPSKTPTRNRHQILWLDSGDVLFFLDAEGNP